mmetsp:Transcript_28195/g.71898  ORF Transcript_28195/g.71898 Transcript_28195/m.71898 type:complete len:313 (+) Transcript_28195:94-1032(+)
MARLSTATCRVTLPPSTEHCPALKSAHHTCCAPATPCSAGSHAPYTSLCSRQRVQPVQQGLVGLLGAVIVRAVAGIGQAHKGSRGVQRPHRISPGGCNPGVLEPPQQQQRHLQARQQLVDGDGWLGAVVDAVKHLGRGRVQRGPHDGVHQVSVHRVLAHVHEVQHLLDARRLLGAHEREEQHDALDRAHHRVERRLIPRRLLGAGRLGGVVKGPCAVEQCHRPHEVGARRPGGEGRVPAQAVARQRHFGGRARGPKVGPHHLLDKVGDLRDPLPSVGVVHQRLLAPPEPQQAQRVHPVLLGQLRDVVPPVVR